MRMVVYVCPAALASIEDNESIFRGAKISHG
jgi:hypothetical protein